MKHGKKQKLEKTEKDMKLLAYIRVIGRLETMRKCYEKKTDSEWIYVIQIIDEIIEVLKHKKTKLNEQKE